MVSKAANLKKRRMTESQSPSELVAGFIMKLCSKERFVEVRRQILCDKKDFEPYVAFSRLSRKANDSSYSKGISLQSLQGFLEDNRFEAPTE